MSLSVKSHQRATEQVELDCEFSGQVTINGSEHLMSSEDVLHIILEIEDGHQFLITHSLDLSICIHSHLIKWHVKL